MGDRANVYIHEGDQPGVYIYTHWYGTALPDLVEEALLTPHARARNNDAPYLTRIVFEELLRVTESLGEETGWGLSATVGDGEDRIVDVDVSYDGLTVTCSGYYDESYEDIYECGGSCDCDLDDIIIVSYN